MEGVQHVSHITSLRQTTTSSPGGGAPRGYFWPLPLCACPTEISKVRFTRRPNTTGKLRVRGKYDGHWYMPRIFRVPSNILSLPLSIPWRYWNLPYWIWLGQSLSSGRTTAFNLRTRDSLPLTQPSVFTTNRDGRQSMPHRTQAGIFSTQAVRCCVPIHTTTTKPPNNRPTVATLQRRILSHAPSRPVINDDISKSTRRSRVLSRELRGNHTLKICRRRVSNLAKKPPTNNPRISSYASKTSRSCRNLETESLKTRIRPLYTMTKFKRIRFLISIL